MERERKREKERERERERARERAQRYREKDNLYSEISVSGGRVSDESLLHGNKPVTDDEDGFLGPWTSFLS
jgi:hypothetical protein